MVSTQDLSLVAGTLLFLLSLPSLLNAWVEGNPPRTGALLSIAGLCLIAFAFSRQSYAPDQMPAVFVRVFRSLFD